MDDAFKPSHVARHPSATIAIFEKASFCRSVLEGRITAKKSWVNVFEMKSNAAGAEDQIAAAIAMDTMPATSGLCMLDMANRIEFGDASGITTAPHMPISAGRVANGMMMAAAPHDPMAISLEERADMVAVTMVAAARKLRPMPSAFAKVDHTSG